MSDVTDNSNKEGRDSKKAKMSYAWMWLWLLLITAGSIYSFLSLSSLASAVLSDAPWLSDASNKISGSGAGMVLLAMAGGVFWWRIVKVTVLLGSPFPFAMRVSWGRQELGVRGRIAHLVHIGDHDVYRDSYRGNFWYGAVFRAHPRSDKLLRTRLEHLVLALPFGRVLMVGEGRFMLAKKSHNERAKAHRQLADRYTKRKEALTPDRFRKNVVDSLAGTMKSLKAVEDYFAERRMIAALDAEGEIPEKLSQEEERAVFAIGTKLSSNNIRSTDYVKIESGAELLLGLGKRGLVKGLRGLVRYLDGNSGYMHVQLTEEGLRVFGEVKRKYNAA